MSDLGSEDMKSFVCGHTAGRKQLTPQATPLTTVQRPVHNVGCPGMPRPRDSSFPRPMSPSDPGGIPTGHCGHCTLFPPCTQLSTCVCCTHTTGDWMAIIVQCACNTAHGLVLPQAALPGSFLVTSFHRRSCFGAACKVKPRVQRGPTGACPKRPPSGTCPGTGPGPCVHIAPSAPQGRVQK